MKHFPAIVHTLDIFRFFDGTGRASLLTIRRKIRRLKLKRRASCFRPYCTQPRWEGHKEPSDINNMAARLRLWQLIFLQSTTACTFVRAIEALRVVKACGRLTISTPTPYHLQFFLFTCLSFISVDFIIVTNSFCFSSLLPDDRWRCPATKKSSLFCFFTPSLRRLLDGAQMLTTNLFLVPQIVLITLPKALKLMTKNLENDYAHSDAHKASR